MVGWLWGVCSDDVGVRGDVLRAVHGEPLELCGLQRRYSTPYGEVSGCEQLLDEVELDEPGEDAGSAPGLEPSVRVNSGHASSTVAEGSAGRYSLQRHHMSHAPRPMMIGGS